MKPVTTNSDNKLTSSPTVMSGQSKSGESMPTEKKKKSKRIDRKKNKYSEAAFLNLARDEQLVLANQYGLSTKAFEDSRLFQFSYSHFTDLLVSLGFKKGMVDTRKSYNYHCYYIYHGKRLQTVEKKITLTKSTNDKLNQLLAPLSNIEKSKAIDAILDETLDTLLEANKKDLFHVIYNPTEQERLI
jgi:hypothetical protein